MIDKIKKCIDTIKYDIKMCNHKQWGLGNKLKNCPTCKDRILILKILRKEFKDER